MIIAIDALNRDRFGRLLDEMFRLRARVFGDRLGWEIDVTDGKEIDQFDSLDPVYLVGLDEGGHVISAVRLLQTTGPYMLSDTFHAILDGEPPLRSAQIWESSRFCVDTRRLTATGGPKGLSRATCEILIAVNDYATAAGVYDIVTVIDPIMDRVLRRSASAPYDYVGRRTPMGKVDAMAALLALGEENGRTVREFAGIEGSVFLTEAEAEARFALNPASQPASNVVLFPQRGTDVTEAEVLSYCIGLIRMAEGEEERRSAVEIVHKLLEGVGMEVDVSALSHAVRSPAEVLGA
jgi:acyl homoserine lactone synthase